VIRLWPGATIRGKVVNAKAQPVAGIRLGASSQATAWADTYWWAPWGIAAEQGGGRTDESGAYSLELAARRASDTKITIRASGDWPLDEAQKGEIALSLRAGETITAPDLVVADSGRRSARILVRDAAGAPIPGALVSRDAFDAGQAVATDSQGYAILGFPGANPGEANAPTRAWAHAEGFALASSNEFTSSAESPPEVVIRLTTGFAIGGRIVRADGSPARNVTIQLAKASVAIDDVMGDWDERNDGPPLPNDTFVGVTRSLPDGSFTLSGVAEGTYHVVATDADLVYRPGIRRRDSQAAAANVASGTSDLLLQMPTLSAVTAEKKSSLVLEVRVRDEQTGGPAYRCDIRAIRGEQHLSNYLAFAPGKYRIVGVEPGEWLVRVYAPDCALAEKKVVIEAGATAPSVDIVVNSGIVLEGTLRDADGGVLRKGRVYLSPDAGIGAGGALDADGRYVVKGIQPNISYRVTATATPTAPGSGEGDFVWYHLGGSGELVFPPGERSVTRDLVVVRASGLVVRVHCPRLPDGTYSPEVVSDEQKANSAASKLQVFDAAGKLVRSVQPLQQRGLETVLPIATYRVRVEVAGAQPQEKTIALDPARLSNTIELTIP
jgi:hypothetical protein